MMSWPGTGLCFVLSSLLLVGCDGSPPTDRPLTVLSVAADCDMLRGCEAGDSDLAVLLSFDAPPRALKPFPIHLRQIRGQSAESASVSFAMEGMDMGLNRYRMVGDAAGGWQANVTLPVCVSGRSDWIATFELATTARRVRIPAAFVLGK
ncbi:MAG: hypothetical protein PVJ83_08620 [Gammaproteobacteria bacterium]|jgi:hypothetical protein